MKYINLEQYATKRIKSLEEELDYSQSENKDLINKYNEIANEYGKCYSELQRKLKEIEYLNTIKERFESLKYKSRGLQNLG